MTSRHRRMFGNVRVKRNFVYSYSNKIKIAPFCRSIRAQCNGIFAERGGQQTKKLRAIEILDIFAWVHYTIYLESTYINVVNK